MSVTAPLSVGHTVERAFQVGHADMDAFASLSGDHNPLHRDAEFARARGFEGPVVFGGLLMAQISRLIGMDIPGPGALWYSQKIRMISPLYVGEPAIIRGVVKQISEAVRLIVIGITISSGERTILEGTAEVRFDA